MGAGFVPEGRCDRSPLSLAHAGLARSAWDSPIQKSRPVGYGLIRACVRTNSSKVRAVNKRQAGSLSYIALWRRRL